MITYNEALTANEFYHVSKLNADKTPMKCRRNGKTKTWKRNGNFMIPVKRGIYEYGYIANFNGDNCINNAEEWNVKL